MTFSVHRALATLPWVAASVPFVWVLARGFPGGDDWQLELARVAAYGHAFADGQWPPFWAPHLYAGYGSPVFLFYGHVVAAVASALHLISGSYAYGFMLALAAAALVGACSLQLAAASAQPEAGDPSAARVAASAFLLNPYLLCDLLLRNAASEYTALCILPLALYGLWSSESGARRSGLWLALGLGLTIATHLLSTLVLLGLLMASGVALERRVPGHLSRVAIALALALACTGFSWLPVLAYKPLIHSGELVTGKFAFHNQFQPAHALFDGSSEYSTGPLPLMAAVLAGLTCWSGRASAPRRRLGALLAVFCVLVFLQTPASTWFWAHVPGLPYLQFPFRLMGPLAVIAALMTGLSFHHFAPRLSARGRVVMELAIFGACLLGALPQLLRMHSVSVSEEAGFEAMLEADAMRKLRFTGTARDEYLPEASRWDLIRGPASTTPIPSASAGLRVALRSDTPRAITLDVRAQAASKLCLARWAFPFWRLELDGQVQPPATCQGGLLGVHVAPGRHRVVLALPPPAARQWGLALSALGLSALFWYARRLRRFENEARKRGATECGAAAQVSGGSGRERASQVAMK